MKDDTYDADCGFSEETLAQRRRDRRAEYLKEIAGRQCAIRLVSDREPPPPAIKSTVG